MKKIRLNRPLRLVLTCLACVVLLLAGLMGGVTMWLEQQGDFLKKTCLAELSQRLGQPCELKSLELRWTPWPVLVLKGLATTSPNFAASFERLVLAPSITKLLQGSFLPKYLGLREPRVCLRLEGEKSWSKASANPASFALPEGVTISIEEGSFELEGQGQSLQVHGLDCYLKTEENLSLNGDLFVKKLGLRQEKQFFDFEDILLLGKFAFNDFFNSNSRFSIKTLFKGQEGLPQVFVESNIAFKDGLCEAKTQLRGRLGEEALPFRVAGLISFADELENFKLSQGTLALGARDHGTMELEYFHGKRTLKGELKLAQLSLTEWFSFVRSLPAGLMRSLDQVTRASLRFELDKKGLRVPQITASCAGATFKGQGGVALWSKPVIFLDLVAEEVDLGRGIPEAIAVFPKEPVYAHGPLIGGDENSSSPSSIGYDIRLGAQKVAYGPLNLGKVRVVIHPSTKQPLRGDIVLDAKASFYEGKVQGSCIFGGDTNLTYAINLQLNEVNGALLGKAWPVIPVRRGRWDGQIAFTSLGTKLDVFLKQLRGQGQLNGREGELALGKTGKNLSFNSFQLRLDPLRQGFWKNSHLGLDGLFKVSLVQQGLNGAGNFSGKLWFGKSKTGFEFQDLLTDLQLKSKGEQLPALDLRAQGRLSFLSNTLRLAEARCNLPNLDFNGVAEFGLNKDFLLNAKGHFKTSDLGRFLSTFWQEKLDLPNYLRTLSGSARLKISAQALQLSELSLKTGLGQVEGSFALDFDKKKTLRPNLQFQHVNLDEVLGGRPGTSKKKFDWNGIEKFYLAGKFYFKELNYGKLTLNRLELPLELAEGVLHAAKIKGSLFDGTLSGSATLFFSHKSIELQSTGRVEHLNLTSLSAKTMPKIELKGQANFSGNFRAAFTSPAEWPACLWGSWNFYVGAGHFLASQAKAKPITFQTFQGKGQIAGGILQSESLMLRGDELSFKGKGELNLQKKTIDCTLDVDKKGLPRFPLYLEGTLDKTKTSFGAGVFILNALGGMFQRLVGIFH